MASKQYVLTTEGLEKLETELDYLKSEKRQEIAEKIKEARGQGDLSENSEYDEAKNEQAQVEGRIAELENILKNAQVLDQDDIDTKEVSNFLCVLYARRRFRPTTDSAVADSRFSLKSRNRNLSFPA